MYRQRVHVDCLDGRTQLHHQQPNLCSRYLRRSSRRRWNPSPRQQRQMDTSSITVSSAIPSTKQHRSSNINSTNRGHWRRCKSIRRQSESAAGGRAHNGLARALIGGPAATEIKLVADELATMQMTGHGRCESTDISAARRNSLASVDWEPEVFSTCGERKTRDDWALKIFGTWFGGLLDPVFS